MGSVNTEIPGEDHKDLHNVKNNVDGQPDTIDGCFEAAIREYVERHWRNSEE